MRPLLALALLSVLVADARAAPDKSLDQTFRRGQQFTLDGRKLVVESVGDKLVLAPPQPPTENIGAFIQPISAAAASQNRPASLMIDGSGLTEQYPRSGVWVHTDNVFLNGASMWNGRAENENWVSFDLGAAYNVAGVYLWNSNEPDHWHNRSVKNLMVQASDDGKSWRDVGALEFKNSSGAPDEKAQSVAFAAPTKARYFKFDLLSNYGENEFGIAEVRFANADKPYAPPAPFVSKYPRPPIKVTPLGQPLKGAENISFPAGEGAIVDVTKAPYGAKGDGVTDDTAAIQKAFDDYPNRQAIIYLPNSVYSVSRQLSWGGRRDMTGDAAKFTVLQGQSRAGTIIKLRDGAPGFENAGASRGVLWTGAAPAQRFGNEVRNLTVDTGLDNPGAAGLQFIANNQGGVFDVSIQSGDSQGTVGLDMGYTDEEGPLLIKNVSVQGFDIGVSSAYSVASITMEEVSVRDQNVVGLRNNGQPISVRKFQSVNSVPAVVNGGGLMVLLDSTLTGTGVARAQKAMRNSGEIYVRNLQTSGYQTALDDQTGGKTFGKVVGEYSSSAPHALLNSAQSALRLPIEETPRVPWDDAATWATPEQFGGVIDDGRDDSEAIQKAIDSGATTVYLRSRDWNINSTVVIRGNVRRIIGEGWIVPGGDITGKGDPVFRFDDGAAPVVSIERLATNFDQGQFAFMENNSKRTLVMKNLCINFHIRVMNSTTYRNTDRARGGKVFIEDCVGSTWRFSGQNVWARQLNAEGTGYKVVNDGGKLWILGLKTENLGGILKTLNGGQTELLGGLSQTNGGHLEPMFANLGGDMSVYFAEQNNSDDPYLQLVVAQKGDNKASWDTPDKNFKGFRPVFYEGRLAK